ncbi:hypothetical protein K501DRAFT_337128 [Backusella circina FSU 941]|nr:hypothetical protein K501DRAFT_337128 [Backusella circina FSU 941]
MLSQLGLDLLRSLGGTIREIVEKCVDEALKAALEGEGVQETSDSQSTGQFETVLMPTIIDNQDREVLLNDPNCLGCRDVTKAIKSKGSSHMTRVIFGTYSYFTLIKPTVYPADRSYEDIERLMLPLWLSVRGLGNRYVKEYITGNSNPQPPTWTDLQDKKYHVAVFEKIYLKAGVKRKHEKLETRLSLRGIYVLKDHFKDVLLEYIVTLPERYKQYITDLKQEGYNILGYCRKSRTKEDNTNVVASLQSMIVGVILTKYIEQ